MRGGRGRHPRLRDSCVPATCPGASSAAGRSTSSSVRRRARTRISKSVYRARTSPPFAERSAASSSSSSATARCAACRRGESPPDDKHQNWVLDVDANVWRMDVMLEPGDARVWTFRRDPSISAPREFMVDRTADSVPFLAPQGVLLYKAKAPRPKDEADFSACLPRLTPPTRTWLRDALQRVHPGHPWIEQLR